MKMVYCEKDDIEGFADAMEMASIHFKDVKLSENLVEQASNNYQSLIDDVTHAENK